MKTITKAQFVSVLDAAGVTPEQRRKLHASFEQLHPEAHQAFLEFLAIPAEQITEIRQRARS